MEYSSNGTKSPRRLLYLGPKLKLSLAIGERGLLLLTNRKDIQLNVAFQYYRKSGFPYPKLHPIKIWEDFFALQDWIEPNIISTLPGLDLPICFRENDLGMAVANYFHPHIWSSHAINMRSAIDAFEDDKALKKALSMLIDDPGRRIMDSSVLRKIRLINGTQICSNFRPIIAKTIYQLYLKKGGRTLDPCAGYGGRLLGFLAAIEEGEYVGIDPSSLTCAGNLNMAQFFGGADNVCIIESPFEDIDISQYGIFDLVFTSPPYFKKEIYSDESTQSCHRYPDYSEWKKFFLEVLIQKSHYVLHDNGKFVINIKDIRIGSAEYPLVKDTLRIASIIGFKLINEMQIAYGGWGKNTGAKREPIFVFEK